jgi:DNA-directed RNA polymerase II subunit RPB2
MFMGGWYFLDNQEDSLIFNKTSIQRGKFRAMSVKKYFMQVQKNQSTSQDDILTKPDPTKVSGMKHGSYDKLNDKGYVEEEVTVEYGDVIFGKITPISDSTGTGKPYRDTSEIYKVGAPGVVDRMYLDTSNQDGYEIRKCCIRSERIPKIGDKYCSQHGRSFCPKAFKLHE